MLRHKQVALKRPWLFDQLRERYEHPLEVRAYERQVAQGLLAEEQAILDLAFEKRGRILALGCGAGREAFILETMGHQVVAADISREMIKAAKKQAAKRSSSITWVWMPAPLEIPLPSDSFDGVVAFAQLLSHIPNSEARVALLTEIKRVLKSQGAFVASFTTRRALREFTGKGKELPGDGRDSERGDASDPSDDALYELELAAGWEDGDILVWDPSEAELDEPLFFHLHTDEEIRNELAAAGFARVELVDPRQITDSYAWDAHRYPFLIAKAP